MVDLPRPYKRSDPPSLPGSDRIYLDGELRRIEQAIRGIIEGYAPVTFQADKNGTNQNIPSVGPTKITFPTERFDVGGYYDAANSRFQPPAGKYRIKTQCAAVNSVGIGVLLRLNGVTDVKSFWVPTFATPQGAYAAVEAILDLNGTDYVEVWVYLYDAAAKNIAGATDTTWFEAEKIQ